LSKVSPSSPSSTLHEVLGGSYYEGRGSRTGPFAYMGPFLGPSAKTAPSRKAVIFNRQTFAEFEPGLILD